MKNYKIVDQQVEYVGQVQVQLVGYATVDTNGRGYSDDYQRQSRCDEVLSFMVRAKTPEQLADKVAVMLGTIEAADEAQ